MKLRRLRHLIKIRKVALPLAMCCLLAILAACTVTFTAPASSGTNPTSTAKHFPSSSGTQGAATIPLSQQIVIDAGSDLYDLDASNGQQLWKRQDSNYIATPVVANGQVYSVEESIFSSNGSPRIVDIDQESGTLRWSHTVSGSNVIFAFLAITGKALVVEMPNAGLLGLNPQTGAQMWQVAFNPVMISGMTRLQTDGNTVFVPASNNIDAIDAASGHILWQNSNIYLQTASTAGMAFIGASCNTTSFNSDNFCLDAFASATGAQRWSSPVGAATCSSNALCNAGNSNNGQPVIGGNSVYDIYSTMTTSTTGQSTPTVDEGIDAFNVKTGALIWQYAIPGSHGQVGQNNTNFNLVEADSSAVYMEDTVGAITALSASNHSVLWKHVNPNGSATQVIENNGLFILVNNYAIVALNSRDGSQAWSEVLS